MQLVNTLLIVLSTLAGHCVILSDQTTREAGCKGRYLEADKKSEVMPFGRPEGMVGKERASLDFFWLQYEVQYLRPAKGKAGRCRQIGWHLSPQP